MVVTTLMGLVNMYYPCGMYRPVPREGPRTSKFYRNMAMVGCTRLVYDTIRYNIYFGPVYKVVNITEKNKFQCSDTRMKSTGHTVPKSLNCRVYNRL